MDQNWDAIVAYGKAIVGELSDYASPDQTLGGYRRWMERIGDPYKAGGIRDMWNAAYGDSAHFDDAQHVPNYAAFGIYADPNPITAPRQPDEIKRLIYSNYNLNVLVASRTWPNGGGGYAYPNEIYSLYPDAVTHGHKWGYKGSGTPQRSWRGGPSSVVENWSLVGNVIIPIAAISVATFGIGSMFAPAGAAPTISQSIKYGVAAAGTIGALSASRPTPPPATLTIDPALAQQQNGGGMFGLDQTTLIACGAIVVVALAASR